MDAKPSRWEKIKHIFSGTGGAKEEPKKLPESTTVPEIIERLLVDKGCTVNREGIEAVAQYMVTTCLHIVAQSRSSLDAVKREIEEERGRWA